MNYKNVITSLITGGGHKPLENVNYSFNIFSSPISEVI